MAIKKEATPSAISLRIARTPLPFLVLVVALAFALGALASWCVFALPVSANQSTGKSLRLSDENYPLTSPLLLCSVEQKSFNQDKDLQSKIGAFIDNRIAKGSLQNMSVYLINYKTSQWVGVNENDTYSPASLIKVPLMIAYYKNAEDNPTILSEYTSFNGTDQNTDEYFKSPDDITANRAYSIAALIRSMIVNSDNTAAVLLENYIGKDSLSEVFTDLHLPPPDANQSTQYISVKTYAEFFRILYNATYLNHAYSQKALELLTHSTFPGIKQGVPSGTTVAEKFGERSVYDSHHALVDRELHDCGIIYKPDSPYLLCIMSRGSNFNQLAQNIRDLSALVYGEVSKK